MSEKKMPKVGDVIVIETDEGHILVDVILHHGGRPGVVVVREPHGDVFDWDLLRPGDDWYWPADAPAEVKPGYSQAVVELAERIYAADNRQSPRSALERAEEFYRVVREGADK